MLCDGCGSVSNQEYYLIIAIFYSPRFSSRDTAMLFTLPITSASLLIPVVFTFTTGSKARHVNLQASNVTSLSSGVSTSKSQTESLAARHIDCDEIHFGRDLNIASCLVAISKIDPTSPTFDTEKTWGQRATGDFDIGLPQRYMGRKYLSLFSKAHGVKCTVELETSPPEHLSKILLLTASANNQFGTALQ